MNKKKNRSELNVTKLSSQRDFLLNCIKSYSIGIHPIAVDYIPKYKEECFRGIFYPGMNWEDCSKALSKSSKEVLKEYKKIK